ncbi:MAG TPA: 50S ribosomal protein L4 [Candidatus Saccharibacteria bacterium]|nr:50S ribosomal protein L4 [Candidatus Saccharibacteria bacterium]
MSTSAATYTKTGTKATVAAKLAKDVFGIEVTSHELLKQAYQAYLSNGRGNLAVVKTRGLVRGGGRKPWKQKGTGRARFGSTRNPIWRGGGIVFGPTGEENYTKALPVKAKRVALRQALSLKTEQIKIVEDFVCADGKSQGAVKLLEKLGATRNILVVVSEKTDTVTRATRNLQNVILVRATYLNVYDILNADTIIMTKDALVSVHEWLGEKK